MLCVSKLQHYLAVLYFAIRVWKRENKCLLMQRLAAAQFSLTPPCLSEDGFPYRLCLQIGRADHFEWFWRPSIGRMDLLTGRTAEEGGCGSTRSTQKTSQAKEWQTMRHVRFNVLREERKGCCIISLIKQSDSGLFEFRFRLVVWVWFGVKVTVGKNNQA